ncbi:MAG: hypothetical protein QHC90_26600 [Shinella sp.]|nr:hypothetical protein [Shinella sp.]
MILIPPDYDRRPFQSMSGISLIASVRAAVAVECGFDTSRLGYRMLGSCLVIEGPSMPDEQMCQIREIAEDIAGSGAVRMRLGTM